MNIVDLIIILILLADIARGAEIGFARQFFNFAGLWGGLILASFVSPYFASHGNTALSKLIIVIAVMLIVASFVAGVGEMIGAWVANLFVRFRAAAIDRVLGAAFGIIIVGLGVWIFSAIVLNLPSLQLSQLVQQSTIVRLVNRILPPAPTFIAKLQHVIEPNGFPQVFLGPQPTPGQSAGEATTAEVNQAVAADQKSVVQLEGIGCGGEVFGSGFVVAKGVVVTNAHVVAGIARPLVVDRTGAHSATVVLFDPNVDLAVLDVSGLSDPALPISYSTVANGTHAVVLGYPGGGPFDPAAASVIQNYIATGRDIYDSGITARSVYELSSDVQPGNSGGPLVLPNGTVIGVVFARSESYSNVGYALTSGEVQSDIRAGESSSSPVSTGTCSAG